jgi:D-glycero-alpha-D-manno-heptose-7-phosphate kinase
MNSHLKHFVVSQSESISDAFKKIDENAGGAVFVMDDQQKVLGIATDGDIRRFLLENNDINRRISECMNTAFYSVSPKTDREVILKKLDNNFNIVPVIDPSGHLVQVYTRKDFPLRQEKRIIARARSPVRVSFSGGGSDLTHYFSKYGGAVMNATIKMYSHSTLLKREDGRISIYSADLNESIEGASIEELKATGKLKLIVSALEIMKPRFGFHLEVCSDFPVGSGLGGSATVLASVIGCFNQFREDKWDEYEIAELAFQAERLTLSVAGGWQDQYATVFGGFNFMEFSENQNVVHPFRVNSNTILELEENLLLCYSSQTRSSNNIHVEQKASYESDTKIREIVEANKNLTIQFKTNLLKGKLTDFGEMLHQGWMMKKKLSQSISNSHLDEIYECARENGAIGGKLLGAGGGGYFLFYAKPLHKFRLMKALKEKGLRIESVSFDHQGLQSWSIREE